MYLLLVEFFDQALIQNVGFWLPSVVSEKYICHHNLIITGLGFWLPSVVSEKYVCHHNFIITGLHSFKLQNYRWLRTKKPEFFGLLQTFSEVGLLASFWTILAVFCFLPFLTLSEPFSPFLGTF